jgi:hypothetical protein
LDIARSSSIVPISDDKYRKIAVVAPAPTEGDVNVGSSWLQGNNYLDRRSLFKHDSSISADSLEAYRDRSIPVENQWLRRHLGDF